MNQDEPSDIRPRATTSPLHFVLSDGVQAETRNGGAGLQAADLDQTGREWKSQRQLKSSNEASNGEMVRLDKTERTAVDGIDKVVEVTDEMADGKE